MNDRSVEVQIDGDNVIVKLEAFSEMDVLLFMEEHDEQDDFDLQPFVDLTPEQIASLGKYRKRNIMEELYEMANELIQEKEETPNQWLSNFRRELYTRTAEVW